MSHINVIIGGFIIVSCKKKKILSSKRWVNFILSSRKNTWHRLPIEGQSISMRDLEETARNFSLTLDVLHMPKRGIKSQDCPDWLILSIGHSFQCQYQYLWVPKTCTHIKSERKRYLYIAKNHSNEYYYSKSPRLHTAVA